MAASEIKIEEITFGCEIECCIPEATTVIAGGYYTRGLQVPELPAGWVAKKDCTIAAGRDYNAVEIVSPVLKGADGLKQLAFVLEWLRSVGAKVNSSCGFHVHTGFSYSASPQLARLVDLTVKYEKALYAASGTRSRETCGFCKPLKSCNKLVGKFADKKGIRSHYDLGLDHGDRFFTLNLTNIAEGVRPAAEYRVFSGTLSTVKAVGFVRLALGLAHKALSSPATRRVKWDASRHQRRKGEGQNALAWLFLELGWMSPKGTKFGVIEGDGIPTLKESKAELVRLAAKYDGGAND
jgi:hypothetical protein